MEILAVWEEFLRPYDSSNDYVKEIIKTGRHLSRSGAVYNYSHDEKSIQASVAGKSGGHEVNIQPFILRRTKRQEKIKGDLPEKIEQKQYCTLTDEQEELYKKLVQEVKEEAKKLTRKTRKPYMMTMIGKLKQLCNHPGLYLKEQYITKIAERSNKVALVDELISTILEADESVIIFTQYVKMGELLQ
ncbi:SNF2-related protein [Paenibacillus lautus]|uniref:SNF2-related protein n=1 Tax=Paenibacillus lautus TaxID=1401 RepID=UPI003D2A98D6